MSLFAASSAASRHLRRHLLAGPNAAAASHLRPGGVPTSASTRHFATGSGLRRTKNNGRRPASSKPRATQPAGAANEAAAESSPLQQRADPHSIANEMVSSASAEGRTPGTESVATLTREQKMSNFAMAGGLLAFVSYIFYYSLASVGGGKNAKAVLFGEDAPQEGEGEKANPGFEEFLKEANEGRSIEEKRLKADREARGEARELAELESSTAARLKAEGIDEAVVGAASAEEEREMARAAGFVEGEDKKRRPLWKRVVFFWRKE